MDDTVGSRIKTLREARRLSQTDLAKLIGISPQSISAYETDTREPSNDVLKSMARLFKVSTDYLLGLERNQNFVVDGLDEVEVRLISELIDYMNRKNDSRK
ncbi:MAG: helix-turn-helix transcriptional regulator [Parasporobacterium sp.]|nr:helix-turn-helix transcriptional regulator [Parasporobacterium sp.]